jgi:hypothetical protein
MFNLQPFQPNILNGARLKVANCRARLKIYRLMTMQWNMFVKPDITGYFSFILLFISVMTVHRQAHQT